MKNDEPILRTSISNTEALGRRSISHATMSILASGVGRRGSTVFEQLRAGGCDQGQREQTKERGHPAQRPMGCQNAMGMVTPSRADLSSKYARACPAR
ncbi:MAG: hypothetical protein OEW21_02365 [Betaproteobacteria bacterium]|nr:hypothetical protein [Betaproteobacteria bacterium]